MQYNLRDMVIPSTIELQLKQIIKQAGSLLLSYWHKKEIRINKKADKSLVTEADLATEKLLITELQKLFPPADFLTEESGQLGSNNNGYRWVIDPLDGTRNFAYHIPYFCISVALTYQNKPIIGVIYNPILDELFYAQEGKGAFCNDQKITIATPSSFSTSFIAFGLSSTAKYRVPMMKAAQKLVGKVAAVRHMGAVALDMANMAIGRFDGLLFTHLAWWDVAAGMLLIQEAGGQVREIGGKPLGPDYKSCIAGSELVFTHLRALLQDE